MNTYTHHDTGARILECIVIVLQWDKTKYAAKQASASFPAMFYVLICRQFLFNLFQTTYFRLFQTQKCLQMTVLVLMKMQKVLQTGRKHCEKRRNCSLRAISPFPTVFSKGLYCRRVKTRACLAKG